MAFNYNQFYSDIRKTLIIQQRNYLRSIIIPLYESMLQQSKADLLSVVLIKSNQPSDAYVFDKDAIPAMKDVNSDIYPWFYENYFPIVRGVILKRGGTERDANDAFGDTITEISTQVWKGDKIYAEENFKKDGSPANSKKHVKNAIVSRSIQIWNSDYRKKKKDEFSDENNYNIDVALDPFGSAENYEKTSINKKGKKKSKKRDPIDHAGNKDISSLPEDSPFLIMVIDPFAKTNRYKVMNKVLAEISKDCRELIIAKVVYNESYKSIAEEFGYSSANYVKKRKSQCIQIVRHKVELHKNSIKYNL